jgi:gliding motility-associated lipoprotein GldH
MTYKKPAFLLSLLIIVLCFSACDDKRIFEENRSLPSEGWAANNPLQFSVDITDPATPANFYLNIRQADGYPYSNIFLFIKTTYPDGKHHSDTIQCLLADDNGKWIGKGIGDLYDNQILFKKYVRFPVAGTYKFELQQGTRDDVLPLIMDAGIRIERAE